MEGERDDVVGIRRLTQGITGVVVSESVIAVYGCEKRHLNLNVITTLGDFTRFFS
jgi:hypothetical protein